MVFPIHLSFDSHPHFPFFPLVEPKPELAFLFPLFVVLIASPLDLVPLSSVSCLPSPPPLMPFAISPFLFLSGTYQAQGASCPQGKFSDSLLLLTIFSFPDALFPPIIFFQLASLLNSFPFFPHSSFHPQSLFLLVIIPPTLIFRVVNSTPPFSS